MFLTKTDLSSGVFPEIRDELARYSDSVILGHCSTAEYEVEGRLSQRYHIRPELEKLETDRNPLLVQITRDIAIWHLYQVAETLPNKVAKRYEDALQTLKDIASGVMILANVPSAPPASEGTPVGDQIGFGSRTPRAPLFQ